ncbi:MAG: hypothetical protein II547_02125, partial [Treponema sp.]|nr:hypothetical protein [Treponema sp.]
MTKQIILLYNKPVDVIIDASCVVSILLAEHEAKEIRKKNFQHTTCFFLMSPLRGREFFDISI